MYKNHLYLVNGEGNDRETALHGTLVYIVTIYDVITKTARVLCRTYSNKLALEEGRNLSIHLDVNDVLFCSHVNTSGAIFILTCTQSTYCH